MRIIVTVYVNAVYSLLSSYTLCSVFVYRCRRGRVCRSRAESGAMRCGVQEGEGVAEWTCKIDSWTRSERVPEVAGINRRAGASFDLSHAPLPALPRPNWSLYCFCRMSPWLRQDAVNGQPPADNSQLLSLN